jgi:hypothetical protein
MVEGCNTGGLLFAVKEEIYGFCYPSAGLYNMDRFTTRFNCFMGSSERFVNLMKSRRIFFDTADFIAESLDDAKLFFRDINWMDRELIMVDF